MSAINTPREVVDAFVRNLNAYDAEALGSLFTPDADFVNIMGMRMRTREGITQGHAWAFAGPLRGCAVSCAAYDERRVTDDVVIAQVRFDRTRTDATTGSGLPDGSTACTFVLCRHESGWLAAGASNVTELPVPTPR